MGSELSGVRGQRHPRAKLSDEDVELARQLYENHAIPAREIARKFETSLSTIEKIIYYATRGAPPMKVPRGAHTPAL